MNKVDISKYKKQDFTKELPEIVRFLDAARQGTNENVCCDLSLEDVIQEKYGLSHEDYMDKLGINTRQATMQNIFTMPDQSIRWIVPEIIRAAITTGIRKAPFYPEIIAHDAPHQHV